jgi:hypothetical protein
MAARGGHLNVPWWLRSQVPPCPWDESTCMCAAEYGHVDTLLWLRGQKPPCPWDAHKCHDAAWYYFVFRDPPRCYMCVINSRDLEWPRELLRRVVGSVSAAALELKRFSFAK